jgi:hypothetical protein
LFNLAYAYEKLGYNDVLKNALVKSKKYSCILTANKRASLVEALNCVIFFSALAFARSDFFDARFWLGL